MKAIKGLFWGAICASLIMCVSSCYREIVPDNPDQPIEEEEVFDYGTGQVNRYLCGGERPVRGEILLYCRDNGC